MKVGLPLLVFLIFCASATATYAGNSHFLQLSCPGEIIKTTLPDGRTLPYLQNLYALEIDLSRNEYGTRISTRYFPPFTPPPAQAPQTGSQKITFFSRQPVFPSDCLENCTARYFTLELALAPGVSAYDNSVKVEGLRVDQSSSEAKVTEAWHEDWESCGDRGGCVRGTDTHSVARNCRAVWK